MNDAINMTPWQVRQDPFPENTPAALQLRYLARYAIPHRIATGSPLLACLGTSRDDPLAWLLAGQALQRVLLAATALGLHASFLSQPIEVDELRARLGALAGHEGYPQILLRIGRGRPAKHTPRRPLEEVLIDRMDSVLCQR